MVQSKWWLALLASIPFILFHANTFATQRFQSEASTSHADHEHKENKYDEHGRDEEKSHTSEEEDNSHGHEEAAELTLSDQQIRSMDIQSQPIRALDRGAALTVTGEIRFNQYLSASITSKLEGQIQKRHVRLGDHVQQGQVVATLYSPDLANLSSDYMIKYTDLQRLKKLKQNVSRQSIQTLTIEVTLLEAKLSAIGVLPKKLRLDFQAGNTQLGQWQLIAPSSGTIIDDQLIIGDWIEPGVAIFQTVDESSLWFDAQLPLQTYLGFEDITAAYLIDQSQTVSLSPVSVLHLVDEKTRTQSIRFSLPNQDHRWHKGMLAKAVIQLKTPNNAWKVPISSVLQDKDGEWFVFVKTSQNTFKQQEVEWLSEESQIAMVRGLSPEDTIVTQGAFTLFAELAKSGFDIHNH